MNDRGAAMAKKKPGRPKGGRDDTTVRIDRRVARMALLVSRHSGIPLAELLTEYLREPVDRAYVKIMRELEGGK